MAAKDFTLRLRTAKSPGDVFTAIVNVRAWWSGYYAETIEGNTEKLNDEFSFRAGEGTHYSKQKLVEVIPGQRLVWLITDSYLNFLEDKDEWTGTRVVFDIDRRGDQTVLTFTHEGLKPEVECYDACAPAWTQYLQNKLQPLINA